MLIHCAMDMPRYARRDYMDYAVRATPSMHAGCDLLVKTGLASLVRTMLTWSTIASWEINRRYATYIPRSHVLSLPAVLFTSHDK